MNRLLPALALLLALPAHANVCEPLTAPVLTEVICADPQTGLERYDELGCIPPVGPEAFADIPTGTVGILTLGHSLGNQAVGGWMDNLEASGEATRIHNFAMRLNPPLNPNVTAINGGFGGCPSSCLANPNAIQWSMIMNRVSAAGGLTLADVQVLWVYQTTTYHHMYGPYPAAQLALAADLQAIIANAHAWLPNLKHVYLSSGPASWRSDESQISEPSAWLDAIGVTWGIEDYTGSLYAGWGPYLWRPHNEEWPLDATRIGCGSTDCHHLSQDHEWEACEETPPALNGSERAGAMIQAWFVSQPHTYWYWMDSGAPPKPPNNCGLGWELALVLPLVWRLRRPCRARAEVEKRDAR